MILNFKTKFPNGKRTEFEQKIWNGFLLKGIFAPRHYNEYLMDSKTVMFTNKTVFDFTSKIHTIREDKTDRWHAGKIIDFFTGARTKYARRFAPRVQCTGTQKISIYKNPNLPNFVPRVIIDGRPIDLQMYNVLSTNDGFDSIDDFCKWFNKDFEGKIIHWTDFRY